jgi:C1A family cysteine protease
MKKIFITATAILIVFSIYSCRKKDNTPPTPPNPDYALGWTGTDNPGSVPSNITFATASSLPASYDLTQYLPPVGNQGPYGTCVAWAVGYYGKSATEAVAYNRSPSDLTLSANQISPKDLFTAIADNNKGANCNGTLFTDALNVIQNRGAATMQVVPYSSLNNCASSNVQSSWTTSAAQHKIKYYRKIDKTVSSIKTQIANKFPVILGAKLYNNFMSWNSSNVYSSNSGGEAGYHAMTIVGYDNNKGPNGAFKVVNSWGTGWGSAGYVWVDYNFMVSQFCYGGNLYIMVNENGNSNPPQPPPNSGGVDLASWVFSDFTEFPGSGAPTQRKLVFNVYNIGNQSALPSSNWAFYYLYYNAYNANDYGVLFYDQFNTSVAPNTLYCPTFNNCNFNYSIPANSSFAQACFGLSNISRSYFVPNTLNGYYYLVLLADATGSITEQNEQNNWFYTTNPNPKFFSNGYSSRPGKDDDFDNTLEPDRKNLSSNSYNTAVTPSTPNAYTPEEIAEFIKEQKRTGALQKKIDSYIKSMQQQQQPPYRTDKK